MANGLTVGVFNDSFPPTIDGVANAAANYARFIQQNHGTAIVATPWYPDTADDYPFEVVRYPSAYLSKRLGYRAGYPFDPRVIKRLEGCQIDLIHTHCPFISTVLGRVLRHQTDAPMVFTYHTKFDIDIEKRVAFNPVRSASIKFVLSNINACDEVWAVSRGAGENLRSLGFEGDYIIMENGADFPKGRSGNGEIQEIRTLHGLKEDLPTFLFVGRMMWYKNIQLILDSLKLVKDAGLQFQMIFAGSGADLSEIQAYTQTLQLENCCIFPGMIRDRKLLKAYFSTADLFLFPSTYDTSGLVVKEAAACSCPSLLVRGSCAAEGVTDGETGILTEETPENIAQGIAAACRNLQGLRQIGENAGEKVYLSWEDAVAKAYRRYGNVLENYEKKQDMLPKNEIFFENVQRVREDITLRAKRKIRHIYRHYRKQGKRIKTKIHYTSRKMKKFLPMSPAKRYAIQATHSITDPAIRQNPAQENETL